MSAPRNWNSDPLYFFFSLRIKPNWGEKRNVIMEDNINLLMWSCVKNCLAFSSSAKETVDVYARPRPFLQPFNSPRRLWSGSVVCISLFNNIGNNIFLCSVCCNLGDIFNVVRCFLICMLACSDGLQHCSSMPRWHQKMSFFTQVYNAFSPIWNVIELWRTLLCYTLPAGL